MRKEKGVTLVSLLTYIAVLLTIMVIVGRITGFYNKRLDNIDSENDKSSQITTANYLFLSETKKNQSDEKTTVIISDMQKQNGDIYIFPEGTTPTSEDTSGTAIKFLKTENVISVVDNKYLYMNKIKISENVEEFEVSYIKEQDAVYVHLKIGEQELNQTYTLR